MEHQQQEEGVVPQTPTRIQRYGKEESSFHDDNTQPAPPPPPPPSRQGKPRTGTARPHRTHRTTRPKQQLARRQTRTRQRRRYYSRRHSIRQGIPEPVDLEEWVGYFSPWAVVWGCIFMSIPICYIYILLVIIRELCLVFPETLHVGIIQAYFPVLFNKLIDGMMRNSSKLVEVWCILEAIFYIGLKLHVKWLQTRDTLEASLSAAPISSIPKRRLLWQRMMELEKRHIPEFLCGWFFDTESMDNISKYDVLDFTAWSMFEGRHQEHLTNDEQQQLELFVEELEYRISLQLYGSVDDDDDEEGDAADKASRNDATTTAEAEAATPVVEEKSSTSSSLSASSSSRINRISKTEMPAVEEQDNEGNEDEDDDWISMEPQELDFEHDCSNNNDNPSSCRFSPRPKKMFRFQEETQSLEGDYYEDYLESTKHGIIFLRHLLYESYKQLAERAATVSSSVSDSMPSTPTNLQLRFHPVQDLKKSTHELRSQMAHQMERAEEQALQIYQRLVPSGSQMDKQLQAINHAITNKEAQFTEAYWNSVVKVQERLESVQQIFGKQRDRIQQQMRSYRVMLNRMLDGERKESGGDDDDDGTDNENVRSSGTGSSLMTQMLPPPPSKQIAHMMRRITECNEALERLESRAHSALVAAANGLSKQTQYLQPLLSQLPTPRFVESSSSSPPQRYAKYNSDPILGVATYPLGFHLLLLGGTEIPLRIMLHKRGFQRKTIGPVTYYVHAGGGDAGLRQDKKSKSKNSNANIDVNGHTEHDDDSVEDEYYLNGHTVDEDHEDAVDKTPIVFVHGIGIGLISYMPLIDALLKSGRPIFLPEIPYVMGFRPWQSPNAVLPPNVVCSCMTVMLASHGFLSATWMGHSYGTSWLSYMCQYASHAVAALLFLDPICFCLHVPRLTKSFVYTRRDPGTISYIVRTDVIVNWTIQRSFPWSWIILFTEQIKVPCCIFLSDKDALVPSGKIEEYFRSQNIPVRDVEGTTQPPKSYFEDESELINCSVFRGAGHGRWTEEPKDTVPLIAMASEVLCQRAEARAHKNSREQQDLSSRRIHENTSRHLTSPSRSPRRGLPSRRTGGKVE